MLKLDFHLLMAFHGHGVAVACDENNIIGWIAWSKSKTFLSLQTRFRTEGLVVDELYHRKEVGIPLTNDF